MDSIERDIRRKIVSELRSSAFLHCDVNKQDILLCIKWGTTLIEAAKLEQQELGHKPDGYDSELAAYEEHVTPESFNIKARWSTQDEVESFPNLAPVDFEALAEEMSLGPAPTEVQLAEAIESVFGAAPEFNEENRAMAYSLYYAFVRLNQSLTSITKAVIRDVFIRNGFTVKEGQSDLKPYVYEAAYDLLALVGHDMKTDAWNATEDV